MTPVYLLFFLANYTQSAQKPNIPDCTKCIFYKPAVYLNRFTPSFNKCKKFGDKNPVSGEITYRYADECRGDESACGMEGKYFEDSKYINFRLFKYAIVSDVPNNVIISMILIYFYIVRNGFH